MKIGKALKIVKKFIERKAPEDVHSIIFDDCRRRLERVYKTHSNPPKKKEVLEIADEEYYKCFVDEVSFSHMGVDWSLYGYRKDNDEEVEENYYEKREITWDDIINEVHLQMLKEKNG